MVFAIGAIPANNNGVETTCQDGIATVVCPSPKGCPLSSGPSHAKVLDDPNDGHIIKSVSPCGCLCKGHVPDCVPNNDYDGVCANGISTYKIKGNCLPEVKTEVKAEVKTTLQDLLVAADAAKCCKDGVCKTLDLNVLSIVGDENIALNHLCKLSVSGSVDAVKWLLPSAADSQISPDGKSVVFAITGGKYTIQAVTGQLVNSKI